ncbi:MAG: hypothetical protein H6712_11005 [Myxococcales bacterium]|nr:hypothetical protein [Myxococcales bacterium]MCB9714379.1 hypothetical protein [Myxococcales bacterium]
MTKAEDAAARLWPALEALAAGLDPDEPTIPTVRVALEGGAVLEVFRAEPVEASMIAWRVRGFTNGSSVRLAVILGTTDGRAMVTERVDTEDDHAVVGGLVADVEPSRRSIDDLSAAIAEAVRARMSEGG